MRAKFHVVVLPCYNVLRLEVSAREGLGLHTYCCSSFGDRNWINPNWIAETYHQNDCQDGNVIGSLVVVCTKAGASTQRRYGYVCNQVIFCLDLNSTCLSIILAVLFWDPTVDQALNIHTRGSLVLLLELLGGPPSLGSCTKRLYESIQRMVGMHITYTYAYLSIHHAIKPLGWLL